MANKKKGQVSSLLEAFLAALTFVGLLGFSTFLVYEKSIETLEEEIKIGLLSSVKSAATVLDGEQHLTFNKNTDRQDEKYLAQAQILENMRQQTKGVKYAYTNILDIEKKIVYFVVNISPQNDGDDEDNEPDPPPALMDVYEAPVLNQKTGEYEGGYSKELLLALQNQKAYATDVYKDQWGTFISAYAPFFVGTGVNKKFIGTIGMDLELTAFYERLKNFNLVFEKARIIVLFLGLVIGLGVWFLRRSHHDSIEKLNNLKSVSLSSEHHFKHFLEVLLNSQTRLLKAFNQDLIKRDRYLMQMTLIHEYGHSYLQDYDQDKIDFNLEQWFHKAQLQLEELDNVILILDKSLPQMVSGKPEWLTKLFVRLILSLATLSRSTIKATFTCSEEGLKHWQLICSLEMPSKNILQTTQALLGQGPPLDPTQKGLLSEDELTWLEISGLSQLLPLFNGNIIHDENIMQIFWWIDKQNEGSE